MENKLSKKDMVLQSIIVIVLGIIFIFYSDSVMSVINYIIGIILIMIGIYKLFMHFKSKVKTYRFTVGALFLIIGTYSIIKPAITVSTIGIVFGLYIILTGIYGIQVSVDNKKILGNKWLWILILGIINLSMGAIMFFNPIFTDTVLIIYIGVMLLTSGIINFISLIVIKKIK